MAEWFKALVLKTSIRKYRKFESCPFRQILNFWGKSGIIIYSGRLRSAHFCFVTMIF